MNLDDQPRGDILEGEEGIVHDRLLEGEDHISVEEVKSNHASSVRCSHLKPLVGDGGVRVIQQIIGLDETVHTVGHRGDSLLRLVANDLAALYNGSHLEVV